MTDERIDAGKAALAAMMASSAERDDALYAGLSREHYAGVYGELFDFIAKMPAPYTLETVLAAINTSAPHLFGVASKLAASSYFYGADYYARLHVRNTRIRRAADEVGRQISAAIKDPNGGRDELLLAADVLTRAAGDDDGSVVFLSDIPENITISRVQTGLEEIDEALFGGLACPSIVVVSARPGVGKTAMAYTIAKNIAAQGAWAVYMTLEMAPEQIVARDQERDNSLPMAFITRNVTPAALARFHPPIGVWNSERERRGIAPVDKIGCLVIDYIQLVAPDGREDDYTRVSSAMRACITLSRRVQCPVIVCSQARRDADEGGDIALGASGYQSASIEQNADVVLFLSAVTVNTTSGKRALRLQDGSSVVEGQILKSRAFIRDYGPFYFKRRGTFKTFERERAEELLSRVRR